MNQLKAFHNRFSFNQVRSAVSGSDTQLRVSWDGVLNADQTGRWWIVGSAWSGTPMIDNSHHALLQKPLAGMVRRLLRSRLPDVSGAYST